MYPDQEIRALAARKERLLRRIGRRREDLVDAGGRLAEKVALFEHWRERVLRWSGLASTVLPFFLGARAGRRKTPPKSRISSLLRWGGLAWRLVRGLKPVTYADRGE